MGLLPLFCISTAGSLVARPPTAVEWAAELASGWAGPDGSSCSLDHVEGIVVGLTSIDYADSHLPANLHDFRYRVIRRQGWIAEATRAELQLAADQEHLARLLAAVSVLVGWSGWKARQRCWIRYAAVRLRGRSSTLPRPHREGYATTGGTKT